MNERHSVRALRASTWPWTTVGDVVESMRNGIYKPASAYTDDGTPCLRMYNIEGGKIIWRKVKRMTITDDEQRQFNLEPGDLLVNRVNSRELVGKAAVIPPTLEASVFESKNIRLRLRRDRVVPEFLNMWFLLSGREYFSRNAQQVVGMASISQPQIAAMPVPVPSLEEQEAVVTFVEEQLSRLEAGVSQLLACQANLKRYRAAVLKAACEGRLVPTEAELARREGRPYEPAEVLLDRLRRDRMTERRRSQRPGERPVVRGDLVRDPQALPEGWTWAGIGECFRVVVGATPSRSEPSYWGGDIPWVSSGEVRFCRLGLTRECITEAALADCSVVRNPPGSVLLGMIGEGRTRGQAAILDIEACNNQNCAAIWVGAAGLVPEYVYCWLCSRYEQTRRIGGGNNQPALNKTIVEAMRFPLPPQGEQVRIAAELDRRLSQADQVGALIDTACRRVRQLRSAILASVFLDPLVMQAKPSDTGLPIEAEPVARYGTRDDA